MVPTQRLQRNFSGPSAVPWKSFSPCLIESLDEDGFMTEPSEAIQRSLSDPSEVRQSLFERRLRSGWFQRSVFSGPSAVPWKSFSTYLIESVDDEGRFQHSAFGGVSAVPPKSLRLYRTRRRRYKEL